MTRFTHSLRHTTLFAASLLCLAAAPATAAWSSDAQHPMLICPAIAGNTGASTLLDDGSGGTLIVWEDYRSGAINLVAQHLLPDGSADPAWPALGRVLAADPTQMQQLAVLAPDGAGGAFVAWTDMNGDWGIRAQHLLAGGNVDARWPATGLPVCVLPNLQSTPVVAPDGSGGVLVAWFDFRSGTSRIYGQHLLADGSLAAGWAANGNPLAPVPTGYQYVGSLLGDGAGGAIVTWAETSGSTDGIYGQHVLGDGALDPAWPAGGRLLSPRSVYAQHPLAVPDGAGGAIVSWEDDKIFAQHLLAGGTTDAAWPDSGRALAAAGSGNAYPVIAADGNGGAFVAWMDARNFAPQQATALRAAARPARITSREALLALARRPSASALLPGGTLDAGPNWDVYASHVGPNGALDVAWPAGGLPVCTAVRAQTFPVIAGDGGGSAFVAWQDARRDTTGDGLVSDVEVQHVRAGLGVDPSWPLDGVAVAPLPSWHYSPALLTDALGGVVCSFGDARADAPGLYAQHLTGNGAFGSEQSVPALAALVDAGFANGVLVLHWSAPGAPGAAAAVERRDEESAWSTVAAVRLDGDGHATCEDRTAEPGRRYAYRLAIATGGTIEYSLESWVSAPAAGAAALRVRNPVRDGAIDVSFRAPDARPVTVELFDVTGRRVASALAGGTAGTRTLSLARVADLHPGVYLVRVGLDRPLGARVAVVR